MSTPDPGWYPDTESAGQIRWWDGTAWSDHVRSADEVPIQEPTTIPGRRRRFPVTKVLVAIVALAAVAAGGYFGSQALLSDDGEEDVAVEPQAASAELFLEARAAPGPDAFMSPLGEPGTFVPEPVAVTATGGTDTAAVLTVSSDTPGLYGGTGTESCDPDALLGQLDDDPGKAKAFAAILGIDASELDDHVAGLAPVLLSRDTRVTNHGYSDGAATPRQSVLEAGTAVLIDDSGVPRVRCSCGNPLAEPAELDDHDVVGEPWTAYGVDETISIAPADEKPASLSVQTPDGMTDLPLGPVTIASVDFANRSYPDTCYDGEYGPELVLVDGHTGPLDPISNGASGATVQGPIMLETEDGPLGLVTVVCTGRLGGYASAATLWEVANREVVQRASIPISFEDTTFAHLLHDGDMRFLGVDTDTDNYGNGATIAIDSHVLVGRFELDPEVQTFERTSDITYRFRSEEVYWEDDHAAGIAAAEAAISELAPLCEAYLEEAESFPLTDDPLRLFRIDDGRIITLRVNDVSGDVLVDVVGPGPNDLDAAASDLTIYDRVREGASVYQDYIGRNVCSDIE